MVNDHSDSERENPLPPLYGLQRIFYMHHPTDKTPVVEHWLEREIAHGFNLKATVKICGHVNCLDNLSVIVLKYK